MAGIGFRLQALIRKGSYLEAASAYLSSAIISSGPWLSGMAGLTVLGGAAHSYLEPNEHTLLLATIITVFAFSLVTASGPQLLITRYIADRVYVEDYDAIAPTCAGVLLLLIPLSLLILPLLILAPFSWPYRVLVSSLFLTLTITWIIATFLSAARQYLRIVFIFLFSYALGTTLSIVLGMNFGLEGSLAGFTVGQVFCLALLVMSVYLEFPSPRPFSLAYLSYIRSYGDLLLIGMLYGLSVWVDSLLFWFSPQASVYGDFFHLFQPYDISKFVVSLSTIPAAAIFMVSLETNFYRYYRRYYECIRNHGTLSTLMEIRQGMRNAVRKGVLTLLKVQGLVALFLCVLARDIGVALGLESQWIPLLRIQTLAGTAQFFVFVIMLFLLYLDRRRFTLFLVALFCLANTGLTLGTLFLGAPFYGLGYLGASLIGVLAGFLLLRNRLQQLEYLTFMDQPIG